MRSMTFWELLLQQPGCFLPPSEGGPLSDFGLRGVSIAGFRPTGDFGCKIFGREAPENGAEGAVLEKFCVFSLKNAFLDQL